ncbi:MAG: Bro-N domain-containing protein, partial [Candidatus Fonsibacter sp.]
MTASVSGVLPLPDHNDIIAMFINEPGLYKLVFRSKVKQAEELTDWVCSEVLPSIRKTGSYMTKEQAIKKWKLIDDDKQEAQIKANNPTGEN